MVDIKRYYQNKDLDSYRDELYYSDITVTLNQMIRVKAVKYFFSKVVRNGFKVLDLGCGSATDIINLSENFKKYNLSFTGVDLGKQLIKKLNYLNIKNAEFINGDIESIDLNKKFDIILELEVAEHLEHFDKNLEVIKKHMKPKSRLIISSPNNKYLLKDLYALVRKVRGEHIKTIAEHKHEQDSKFDEHINVMSYPEFKKKLEKHGFEIMDKRRFMIHFGAKYLDPFYAFVAFVDWILPKKVMYLGSGYVVLARLKK